MAVAGELAVAQELRALAARAGFDARDQDEVAGEVPWLLIDAGADPEGPPLQGGPVALLCADGSLHALDAGGGAVGFHVLPPLEGSPLVELTRGDGTAPVATERAEAFFAALGLRTAWVGDAPGLVLGRIVAQLVNEACFAVGEGVGSRRGRRRRAWCSGSTIRAGRSPGARRSAPSTCIAVLDGLRIELGEERYRTAPLLRRLAR